MGDRSPESLSIAERAPFARYARVIVLLLVPGILVWADWNEAGSSASVLHNRIFLIGVALASTVMAVTYALVPWWEKTRTWLIAAHLVIMGLCIGLAIATTDWAAWPMRHWWQGWWTPWIVLGQFQQVQKLLRCGPKPPRPLRLLNA